MTPHSARTSGPVLAGRIPQAALAATFAAGMFPAAALANDFAYESAIFTDAGRTPVETHTTIFVGETVYDWQAEAAMVMDFAARRVTVLDAKRRVKTTLKFVDMERRLGEFKITLKEHIRTSAGADRALLLAMLNPDFFIKGDTNSREVVFDSPFVTYNVAVVKPSDDDLRQKLARFFDVSTRLSSLQSPLGLARMPVNDWLNSRGMAPMRIERSTKPAEAGARPITIRSEHELRTELTNKDRVKVDDVQLWLRDFRAVDFDAFQPKEGDPR